MNGLDFIELKDQIAKLFGRSEWVELGFYLNCQDIITGHGRLLRSLDFGDDDYDACILEVLSQIIKKDPENVNKINEYIARKFPDATASEFVSTAHKETPTRKISFSPDVFKIPAKSVNEKLVVVMMPFNKPFSKDVFEAIKKSCVDLGLECVKADDIWENSVIMQDVFELIFTSKIVVGDFTGKNPNVFYEIGIAHTLGKTVIPITQSTDDIPFDLAHHRVLKYLANTEGYSALQTELVKRLQTLIPTSPKAEFLF